MKVYQFTEQPYYPAWTEHSGSLRVNLLNRKCDPHIAADLFHRYYDEWQLSDELGLDIMLNEHHQNIYGLMPSPNLIAAALSQRTKRGKIVILGNLLPLHLNPLRMAEEYAMLDNMSDGRLIAGFAPGSGPETFNYDVPSAPSREQFWEAVDLIARAWREDGPFAKFVTEENLSLVLKERGMRIAVVVPGIADHIGDDRHAHDPFQPKRAKTFLQRMKRSIAKRLPLLTGGRPS